MARTGTLLTVILSGFCFGFFFLMGIEILEGLQKRVTKVKFLKKCFTVRYGSVQSKLDRYIGTFTT